MKKRIYSFFKFVFEVLIVAAVVVLLDRLVAGLSSDDSIWLGDSVVVVASVILGPLVGSFATLLSATVTDILTYGSLEYTFAAILESASIFLIGTIYRKLTKDNDNFGLREIVIFNFVQILVNAGVIYLATPPVAVLFFDFIVEDWSRPQFAVELKALSDNAFSACISIALIGTLLLSVSIAIRKHIREQGGLVAALRTILKPTFLSRQYRPRALEYSVGMVFSVALTMVDGIVSGRILGANALAATSLMFPLTAVTSYASNLITTGCSNLCARAKGYGDYERARKLFSLGFAFEKVV